MIFLSVDILRGTIFYGDLFLTMIFLVLTYFCRFTDKPKMDFTIINNFQPVVFKLFRRTMIPSWIDVIVSFCCRKLALRVILSLHMVDYLLAISNLFA